jgi:hypothetical protein
MERIRIDREQDAEGMATPLRITIRMRPRPLATMGLLIGILFCAMPVGMLLRQRSGFEESSGSGIAQVAVLIFLLPGLAMLCRLVWTLIGRETLFVHPRALAVRRSIGPIGLERTYFCGGCPGRNDTTFRPSPYRKKAASWELLCLETERECVVLRHRERYVRLARGLDKAEGVYLLTAIRIWMQAR